MQKTISGLCLKYAAMYVVRHEVKGRAQVIQFILVAVEYMHIP